ncbi:hypothetical protein Afer_0681 [Acidimicrobium ferrooxidans DSM 10331]|uniref:Uncharacterized protein n=1 Tax=Acidimicrobium ferrooxidans (strain DSM 10331 / JCM 15462 / NBRC 103882 / ICP) TaxID=525909 RepID=C7LY25_ACIFD|nr:hypothetical protein [Acidimicrobium ferrooxidans]ACU53633.1 hypothetical protein Afer_0681 [Acidimicrobium ferrooxidans DSM 10331]
MVEIEVRGPGHHERSTLAARAVAVLAGAGLDVGVVVDVRPRLAADIEAQLEAGAARVVLTGPGFSAVARTGREGVEEALSEGDVLIRLRATADELGVYGVDDALGQEWVRRLRDAGVPCMGPEIGV